MSPAQHTPGKFEKLSTPSATPTAPTIPLEDRLPTFAELDGFDAAAACDRLTPSQQREIGILAVRFGTIGQCDEYFHETLDKVRNGIKTSHWTPEVMETAVWPPEQIEIVETAAHNVFNEISDHFDPLWPVLFGWVKPTWSKPVIRQVA